MNKSRAQTQLKSGFASNISAYSKNFLTSALVMTRRSQTPSSKARTSSSALPQISPALALSQVHFLHHFHQRGPLHSPPHYRYWVKTGAAMHCEAQCKVLLSVHRAFLPLDPVHSLSPLHWNPSTGENHNRHTDPECISKLRSLLEGTALGLLIQTPRGQKGFETPNRLKLSSLTFSSQPSS